MTISITSILSLLVIIFRSNDEESCIVGGVGGRGSRILLSYGRADWLKSGSVGAFYNTRRPSGPRATEGMIDCHLMLEAL